MKLVVLDPGLDSTAGHHYHLDLVLREQAAAHGVPSVFYGFKGMDPAIEDQFDARLIFDLHSYAKTAGLPELAPIQNWSTKNASFCRNLCDGVPADFAADDIVVMRQGKVVEQGPADAIFDTPQEEYTRNLIDSVPGLNIELGQG